MPRLNTKRNRQIIRALRSGKSTVEVGASFGLTPLRVRQIAAAYGARELRREHVRIVQTAGQSVALNVLYPYPEPSAKLKVA